MKARKLTLAELIRSLPWPMAQQLRAKTLPPITKELVLKLYLQVYQEWKERKKV